MKVLGFEESMRMLFIARFPKEIEANSINKDIINNVDFAPTLLDFAGVKTPKAMQGRSFRRFSKAKRLGPGVNPRTIGIGCIGLTTTSHSRDSYPTLQTDLLLRSRSTPKHGRDLGIRSRRRDK